MVGPSAGAASGSDVAPDVPALAAGRAVQHALRPRPPLLARRAVGKVQVRVFAVPHAGAVVERLGRGDLVVERPDRRLHLAPCDARPPLAALRVEADPLEPRRARPPVARLRGPGGVRHLCLRSHHQVRPSAVQRVAVGEAHTRRPVRQPQDQPVQRLLRSGQDDDAPRPVAALLPVPLLPPHDRQVPFVDYRLAIGQVALQRHAPYARLPGVGVRLAETLDLVAQALELCRRIEHAGMPVARPLVTLPAGHPPVPHPRRPRPGRHAEHPRRLVTVHESRRGKGRRRTRSVRVLVLVHGVCVCARRAPRVVVGRFSAYRPRGGRGESRRRRRAKMRGHVRRHLPGGRDAERQRFSRR
jgi:hypothetical protein